MMQDERRETGGSSVEAGRTLALDFGDRRIGIALSDPLGLAASPLMTLERTSWARDFDRIRDLVRENEVRRIVVGLPLDMDGGKGARARLTESFMDRLRGATGLPVIPWDERLTTVQAERILLSGDVSRARRRQVVDQVAAVIVLQAYLDSRRDAGGA
jgi:putative Holliday junction resolvase